MAIYRGDGGAGVANPTYETAVIADQTGNSGKYLTTDGSNTSWVTLGTGGTVTSVNASGGSTGFTFSGGPITTSGTLSLDGTLGIGYGGTNATTAAGARTNLLPSFTGNAGKVLAVNTGATDVEYITVGGSGTVTSVSATVPTGLSISGSPITTSGTLAITLTAGYSIPTTSSQTNWDSAYTQRLQWDGGSTNLVAATGRTSLGLGTAATMTGPSGTIVGTTDTQTLSAKTLTSPIISSISNTGTLTLPTSTDTLVGRATTDTLTNKRITPRVSTTTSSGTPTINTDNMDMYGLTAQAVDITSFTTNLTGTPTNGQKLWIYIVGTAARAITWGASFESSTVTLPTTTVTTNRLDVGFVWNSVTSKWRCVAVA